MVLELQAHVAEDFGQIKISPGLAKKNTNIYTKTKCIYLFQRSVCFAIASYNKPFIPKSRLFSFFMPMNGFRIVSRILQPIIILSL